ncbi:hypothetical protein GCK72_003279 [Caenorhabditis remanei]|uniref:Uncharacterized protein n=1 Tax=Caenorhabditis remanei TaxID=31234 RepID=A0A6A5HXZ5_CAERE|nr:hypothetical protein GCK72_003279 [Caenorhabditis remanei]KAF1771453.1 hypothetical protein GCK72_003279 [Caenorhabditis remanei]
MIGITRVGFTNEIGTESHCSDVLPAGSLPTLHVHHRRFGRRLDRISGTPDKGLLKWNLLASSWLSPYPGSRRDIIQSDMVVIGRRESCGVLNSIENEVMFVLAEFGGKGGISVIATHFCRKPVSLQADKLDTHTISRGSGIRVVGSVLYPAVWAETVG